MSADWRPSCMTTEEYTYWYLGALRAYRLANLHVPPICADCPASFQEEAGDACNTIVSSKRRVANPRRERLLALRAEGLTWGQVGARMGLTWRQAYDVARKPAERAA